MLNNKFQKSLRAAIIAGAMFTAFAAYAQNAVGSWTGRVDLSGAKPKDANEKTQIDMAKKMLANSVFKLTLNKDKTYVFVEPSFGGKSNTEKGKWSQKGNVVTVVDPKGKAEKMVLSKDGKTMVNTPGAEDHAPAGIKLVFKKA